MREVWNRLLGEARAAHSTHLALGGFCPFPDDITDQPVTPHHINAARLLDAEHGFDPDPLGQAFIAASPLAQWRETYKGTDIGQDFMDRFGCYCLIGQGGAFRSDRMAAYVVYMPPRLHYPWHHHPAEEMYLVLAGEGRFMRAGAPDEHLRKGDTSFHASNQAHAMETGDSPVLAYVVWRSHLGTPPVLTEVAP